MIQLFVIIILFIGGLMTLSVSNHEVLSDLEETSYFEVNELDGVNMMVIDETVSPTGLTLLFENETDTEFTYGEEYLLEMLIEDEWYEVPAPSDEDFAFESIGYLLTENDSEELDVDWEWLFGTLEPGEYRIVKEVLDVIEPGNFEAFPLSAEFTIEQDVIWC